MTNEMPCTKLGNTGIEVSKVGFGVLTVGRTQLDLPLEDGADVIRYALERGINFLDTAQYYRTYPYIREALKGTNFNPVIVSKCLSGSRSDMQRAIEEARRELDRDVIDIFLLHEVRSMRDFRFRSGAWEVLLDAKAKGIIRAMGVSTHHIDVTDGMAKVPECDVVFPLINFKSLGIRKGTESGSCDEMADAILKCSKAGKGVFTMKVFGGGNLTGSYSKALDYVFGLEGVDATMIGFGKRPEVDMIFDYMAGRLPKDFAPDVSYKRIHIEEGNCEGCGACVARCPNGAITLHNYKGAVVNPSKCLTCGYCAPVCPVRAIIMW
ncbi:MAG: aldo/keto reductase [Clostridia bacterium]|nr:aldo/keto reductase [Clostridia bacterium]